MNPALRVIDTGERSARWNIAMTAALAELHHKGEIGDTLRLHRYPRSVLIGRNQSLAEAVDLAQCEAYGVEVARRVTGGGAVYMTPGALAWDLVMARKDFQGDLARASEMIGAGIAAGLMRLGLPARYRAQNEVEIGGRKICGLSGSFDGGTLVCQGTILIDVKFDDMARFLRLPLPQTQRNLHDHLTTVTERLGRAPAHREIERALAAGLSEMLGRTLSWQEPGGDELRLADEWHRSEFGRDDFVDGESRQKAKAS